MYPQICRYIFCLGFFLCFAKGFSQDPLISFSPTFKISNKDFIEHIPYADSNSVLLFRERFNALGEKFSYVEKLHGDGLGQKLTSTLIWKKSQYTAPTPFRLYYEGLVRLNNRLVLIVSNYDHEKNIHTAYGKFLDNDGYPDGEYVQLAQIEAERKSNRGDFEFSVSPSGNYLMVYSNGPIARNESEQFTVHVVDTSLALSWKNSFELSYKDREFVVHGLAVDDNGNGYVTGRIYLNRTMMIDQGYEKAEYFYTMLFLRPEDEPGKYTEKTLKIEGKYMVNLAMRFHDSGNILMSGTFANDNGYDPAGLYFLEIEKETWNTDKITLHSFPEGFIPEFETDIPFQFGEDGFPVMEITHFMASPMGGSILIAEHSLVSEYCYTDFRTALTTCNYSYFYNDVFVFHLNDTGGVEWKLKIPKKQVSRNDYGGYSSFALGSSPLGMYLLYNDDPDNSTTTDPKKYDFMNDVKKAEIISVHISWDGKTDKKALGTNDDLKAWFRPRMYYQFGEDLYTFASKRNHVGVSHITLPGF